MSGRIPREFINELLVRVDIVDLIDSHLPLKKTGANYVARCPFHTEKTPSFSVNRKKQFFHCFGCGASGNAISFLMDFNHLEFVEAVEDLAAFVGIDVPKETSNSQAVQIKDNLGELYLLMEQVAFYYAEQLRANKNAQNYLKTRGVKAEVARDFTLGFAPDEWNALTSRFNQNQLTEAGLAVKKDDNKVYDRFRGRIMFPIRDKRGRIIGFGGRVLDDSLPKYLNSPETRLFHKGKEVYGLYELLKKNSRPSRILIVEGYMDVIALTQFGIHYAVAALGTAASQAHIELLFRFSSELVFCFDGDNAGRDAAWRVMDAVFSCLKDGRQVRIMLLPQGHDPDSLIREEGQEKFTERVQTAQALSDYFFSSISNELNLSEKEGQAKLVDNARTYLEKLPNGIFRELMFNELSRLATLSVVDKVPVPGKQIPGQGYKRPSLARIACALLIQHPELAEVIEEKDIDLSRLKFKGIELFKNILQLINKNKPSNGAALLEYYRDTAEEKTVKALAGLSVPDESMEQEFYDTMKALQARTDEDHIALSLTQAHSESELKDIAQLIIRAKTKKF